MPELPDIEAYRAALRTRVGGKPLRKLRVSSFSLLRTYDPLPEALHGKVLHDIERLGKRLVLVFEDDLFAVVHLMIAGRLAWAEPGKAIPKKIGLAAFDFDAGTVLMREAGTKKRASLHVHRGREALGEHDRGGIEPIGSDRAAFEAALTRANRTLKRALTDQHALSGIGNAFSDEILHAAKISPIKLTGSLGGEEIDRLHAATGDVLTMWRDRLVAEAEEEWPDKVTAFRTDFAVHGKFGDPCPVCGRPVQRIRYADNETNYCAECQTGGKRLADRALSRILKDDWPRSLDEAD